ncbi:MAG: glycoside hydrolase family 3 C-terminal domain-containing protein [Bacteroidales bacterium]|nr:glycoside hydrolase family 3 C-terminal domain-containing protein [Bacteroidales bacterium]
MFCRILFPMLILLFSFNSYGQLYKDPNASIDERVEDLLSQMTLAEKIGQMTQAERSQVSSNNNVTTYFFGSVLSGGGSVPSTNTPQGWADLYDMLQGQALATRLGIPLLYGIDAVHGHNNLYGAVIFPHNIGMGCTRDTALVKQAARITATEVAATGLDWTFSPCIAVPRDERWGRTYEGFSEDPALVAAMAAATVEGYQGDTLADSVSIIACVKHYLGDGGTTNGVNTGNTEVDEATLRAIHLPGYINAVNSHVATVMASYSSWNGEKMHGNKYLITDVLKGELGFKGFVVSDWHAIEQMPGTLTEQIKKAINAGIDMSMEPYSPLSFISTLTALVNAGEVPIERIDNAVRRILRVKFEMGLFERPYANRTLLDSTGTKSHRNIARQCVRESLVLLKKRDDLLPLAKANMHILVAGGHADNVGYQCGGWTLTHQGVFGDAIPGTSIYDGLLQVAPGNTYTYSPDGSEGSTADAGIIVIGEGPYAEGPGDRSSIDNIISTQQIELVKKVKSYGMPVIVILVTGRPVNIMGFFHYADAIIAAWLPGTEGQGIADVLFGDYIPTGRLSYSWPVDNAQLPINVGDTPYDPFYPYDYGITSFDNATPGSLPEFYSAAVSASGDYIELSFNKKMLLPQDPGTSFTVTAAGTACQIITSSYAPGDSFRVRLEIDPLIYQNDPVYLSYSPGTFTSADLGLVGEIVDYKVLNNSEIADNSFPELLTNGSTVVWPNPAGNFCYLYLQDFDCSAVHIEIFDLSGQQYKVLLMPVPGKGLVEIGLEELSAGFYLIRVLDNGKTKTLKLRVVK